MLDSWFLQYVDPFDFPAGMVEDQEGHLAIFFDEREASIDDFEKELGL